MRIFRSEEKQNKNKKIKNHTNKTDVISIDDLEQSRRNLSSRGLVFYFNFSSSNFEIVFQIIVIMLYV